MTSSNEKDHPPQHEENGDTEDFKTLKYHLLGPSLTKAGQDAVDQSKVSSLSLSGNELI